MTIAAMLSGVVQAVDRKTSANGKPYVLLRLRVPDGEGPAHFVGCFVFSDHLQAVAAALGPGAAVSVSGALRVATHEYQGEHRPQLSLTADALLTLHERRRVDKAIGEARSAARAGSPAEPPAPPPSRDQQRVDQANRETRQQWKDDPSGFDSMSSDTPF